MNYKTRFCGRVALKKTGVEKNLSQRHIENEPMLNRGGMAFWDGHIGRQDIFDRFDGQSKEGGEKRRGAKQRFSNTFLKAGILAPSMYAVS